MNAPKRVLTIALLCWICLLSACGQSAGMEPAAADVIPAADELQAILAATVQIAMFEQGSPPRPASGSAVAHCSRGLGTAVRVENEIWIITHDHWSVSTANVYDVVLRDAWGRPLVTLDRERFRQSLRFGDNGTVAFTAPEEMLELGVAPVETAEVVPPAGATVQVVHRHPHLPERVQVLDARVAESQTREGQPALLLQPLYDDAIHPGDSGGGVWLNGALLGNIWSLRSDQTCVAALLDRGRWQEMPPPTLGESPALVSPGGAVTQ